MNIRGSAIGRLRNLEKSHAGILADAENAARDLAGSTTRLRENISMCYGGGPTGLPPMTTAEAREYRGMLNAKIREAYGAAAEAIR